MRPFRFGLQITADDPGDVVATAQRAENLGVDIVLLPDHLGSGPAPMPMLASIAEATESVRLGTFVLNAAMRNPVQLAWEARTIDHISNGRFELGLGAGHTPQEFDATGIERESSAQRKAGLAEQIEIIRRLLDGQEVSHDGPTFVVDGASLGRSVAERLPILVGGNGAALLGHAGAHADIVGLQGLGRTKTDGHQHEVKWTADYLDEQIAQISLGAGDRFDDVELNALVQSVVVTDDADHAIEQLRERVRGLGHEDAVSTPYVLIGTVDEIIEKLMAVRERWGISYFVVRDLESFVPIIDRLRGA